MNVKRIIVVEDDLILNLALCECLETFGYKADPFYCAAAAIEAIRRRDYLSALVTDIDLGAGADGFQIAAQARRLYPSLPVVFASGTHGAQHTSYGVRGSAFVPKPFHPHQIIHALQSMRLEAA
jgi:DNA-binding response OmpR family regulator